MVETYIDGNGRRRFSDSGILVSRWIGEKKMGRKLGSTEDCHHKDGNKRNDSWKNIQVYTGRSGHRRHLKENHGW